MRVKAYVIERLARLRSLDGMARLRGSDRLARFGRPLQQLRRPRSTGLVISGGGARADFEIGALRYLYDQVGIEPKTIVGTSAGSILAAILAQSSDAAEQRRKLGEIEQLWRGLQTSDELFAANDWFEILRRRGLEWADTQLKRQQQPRTPISHTLARVTKLPIPTAQHTDSSIGMVEVLSTLRELGRASPELEGLLHSLTRERSLYRLGPIVEKILGQQVLVPSRVPESGVTLRMAVVSLESGELRYVTEKGALVDRRNRPVEDGPFDLTEAIRASCAIPAVFAPVQLGEDNYVDGGVRETLPTRIAAEHLGVTTCYAIVAHPAGVPKETSYRDADLMSVVIRATAEIMTDEELQDEVAGARRDGAIVIEPELALHDVLTVEPGLTAISMDYGYLRAAETVRGATEAESRLIRDVIMLRRAIWQLERELFVPHSAQPVPDPGSESQAIRLMRATLEAAQVPAAVIYGEVDLTELGTLKRKLRSLVARIPADLLPPGADDWWRTFEAHNFEVPARVTWA